MGDIGVKHRIYADHAATTPLMPEALPGRSGEGLVHILDLKGIAVSAGAACDSRNTQVSHVLKAIRLPVRQAKGVIRISLGSENTVEDVERIISAFI